LLFVIDLTKVDHTAAQPTVVQHRALDSLWGTIRTCSSGQAQTAAFPQCTTALSDLKRKFHAYPLGSSADGLHCRNNLRLCCSGFARMQRLLPVSSRSLHDSGTAEGFELNLNLSRILEASYWYDTAKLCTRPES